MILKVSRLCPSKLFQSSLFGKQKCWRKNFGHDIYCVKSCANSCLVYNVTRTTLRSKYSTLCTLFTALFVRLNEMKPYLMFFVNFLLKGCERWQSLEDNKNRLLGVIPHNVWKLYTKNWITFKKYLLFIKK